MTNLHACIVTKGDRTTCLPQFSDKDVISVSISYTVDNLDRTVIVSSLYRIWRLRTNHPL